MTNRAKTKGAVAVVPLAEVRNIVMFLSNHECPEETNLSSVQLTIAICVKLIIDCTILRHLSR
ncbi:hypothetical protein T02_6589 [Trichinella nativa]|uniref:Uncharacterized protein n=2 Tax=Trichinella TaxID=6333 RepID=A0A0V1L645_9BILA|nr:hypothetical protein T03_14062 [Trichinella britovi]KRZ54855.1 hypothetical protein T02_6589 [Trichinella nativa]